MRSPKKLPKRSIDGGTSVGDCFIIGWFLTKSIKDILEFAPGTIVELNKIAGESVDVLVNGKYVAKGEVVVIEESFGVRITEIIK